MVDTRPKIGYPVKHYENLANKEIKQKDLIRFVVISDTHNQHERLEVPEGDVLIHLGDITLTGDKKIKKSFAKWFKKQPHPIKIIISGNENEDPKPEDSDLKTLYKDIKNLYFLEDATL